MNITDEQYLKDCNDFFAPLEQIGEALRNDEGIYGITNLELIFIVNRNEKLKERLMPYIADLQDNLKGN